MRVLEAHVVEVRLLGAEGALELADLLLEAHAAAALLDGVLVESFALLRERHEFVRLRGTRRRRYAGRRRSTRSFGGPRARKRGRRFMTVLPKIPSLSGIVSYTGVIAAGDQSPKSVSQESSMLFDSEIGGTAGIGFTPTESRPLSND